MLRTERDIQLFKTAPLEEGGVVLSCVVHPYDPMQNGPINATAFPGGQEIQSLRPPKKYPSVAEAPPGEFFTLNG